MREADLPLMERWLRQKHLQRWWRDPSASQQAREKYLPRIRGDEPTDMFVITVDARVAGFIQSYRMRDHPTWAKTIATTGLVFPSAAGIDYAISERDLIGRGIGSAAVGSFTELVLDIHPDVAAIVVTPQAANHASCRVLEKAGYEMVWTGMLDSDDPGDAGPAALYVRHR